MRTPMQRAVAFCQVIEHHPGKTRTHKVSSKHIAAMFQPVVEGVPRLWKVRHRTWFARLSMSTAA